MTFLVICAINLFSLDQQKVSKSYLKGILRYTKLLSHVNPFSATGIFAYLLKTTENQNFSDFLGV